MRGAYTDEPELQSEKALFNGVLEEIKCILHALKLGGKVINYVILRDFGLDIAVFITTPEHFLFRCIELKVYKPSSGRIGVGNQRGEGRQIDILLLNAGKLALLDVFCRWIIADSSRGIGTPRYVFCTNSDVKEHIMGQVRRGKQNNISPHIFNTMKLLTWNDLSTELEKFLISWPRPVA